MTELPEYIDAHCHLAFAQYDTDRTEVVERLKTEKVWAIGVGCDADSSRAEAELAAAHGQGFFTVVGQHPSDKREEVFDENIYRELLKNPKVVGIGECGLDYSKESTDHVVEEKRQHELFEKHISLALDLDKPLMLHCRDAYDEVLEILKPYSVKYGSKLRGNVHFFAGTIAQAQAFIDIGFTLSFTGVITFAKAYEEVVRFVPLDRMLSETDAPFVAPVPYRGKRNDPVYVKEVVKKIAEIKGEDLETVKKQLVGNAVRLFGLR